MADVTKADVRAAEQEAADDVAKVETLKQRVMSGEDVGPDELAKAQQLSEWSTLRVEAVRQQAEQTAERKRQEACADVRADIEAHLPGDTIATKLKAVEEAAAAYFAEVEAHNERLGQWRKRMQALGVPEHKSPIAPPEQHARLGWADGHLFAGRRRLGRVEPGVWLTRALEAARATVKDTHVTLHLLSGSAPVNLNHPDPTNGDPYATLTKLTDESPEPTSQHHYLGAGGAVISVDKPYPAEEIKRLKLRTITQKEAWGE